MTESTKKAPAVLSLLWQTITPLHPGTGQVSASVIDLPVAREGATQYPMIPASSIKGVLRDGEGLRQGDEKSDEPNVAEARKRFGYADYKPEGSTQAESGVGDLSFTDARLLALPVPSYLGTYALVTCPLVLRRLSRDRELLGLSPLPAVPTAGRAGENPAAAIAPASVLKYQSTGQGAGKVILQDLDFEAREDDKVKALADVLGAALEQADRQMLSERLCIVHDDFFAFLCESATEVTAHVRLEADKKTVMKGMLWYEETVPAEALLTSFVFSRSGAELEAVTQHRYLQVGGKGSVGRGLLRLYPGETAGSTK